MDENGQDSAGLCPLHHPSFRGPTVGRRAFLKGMAGVSAAAGMAFRGLDRVAADPMPTPSGPRSKKPPVLKVGYLRHPRGVSGGWPGHG